MLDGFTEMSGEGLDESGTVGGENLSIFVGLFDPDITRNKSSKIKENTVVILNSRKICLAQNRGSACILVTGHMDSRFLLAGPVVMALSMNILITTPLLNPINFTNLKKKLPNSDGVKFSKILAFLKVTDNKDKLLKVLQYICKLLVVSSFTARTADLKSFASTLSLARKLGRLGNWLPALEELNELSTETNKSLEWTLQTISALSSLGNDLLDDWICLQKGKLLTKQPYLDELDHWSTRLWFISVSIDLHFAVKKLRKTPKEDSTKHTDALLTVAKLSCDWLFCLWEIAAWSAAGGISEYVPVFAGFSAACLGSIRGWRKLK